jgi:hypothetical protein
VKLVLCAVGRDTSSSSPSAGERDDVEENARRMSSWAP